MSAMVQRIRPNGDLVIAGEEQVQLVGGKEYIRLAGVVRPEDVLNNNSFSRSRWRRRTSSSVATAKPTWRQG